MKMNKAVFLDRDGVITHDPPHYSYRIDQPALVEDCKPAIKKLNDARFKVIVIINQSGVEKGMYEEKDIRIFNDEMTRQLKQDNAYIDASITVLTIQKLKCKNTVLTAIAEN